MWSARIAIGLAFILLPGIVLAPAWSLAGLGAGEDDILYYLPSRIFLHESVAADQRPWINPWSGLARPHLADPQSALLYPPTWLFALLPPLDAYPLTLWLHYSLALWGMYRLLRAQALSRRAAVFGAVAFGFCGFMLGHRAHLTMQHAAAWAPWVLWRWQRYVAHSRAAPRTGRSALPQLAAAAFVAAAQGYAGHVQVSGLTFLAALVYSLADMDWTAPSARLRRISGVIGRWALLLLLTAGLFAAQWMPTLSYLLDCSRLERTYGDFVENSWSAASAVLMVTPMLLGQRTPNFFEPAWWGPSHQSEQFAYVGLLTLALALLALRAGWWTDRSRRRWIILALFGLLLALGRRGPIAPVLYWIPGSSLFRCPARAMLLVDLALAALAAVTLNDLAGTLTPRHVRLRARILRLTRRPLLLAGAVIAGVALLVLFATLRLDPQTRAAALDAIKPWHATIWVPLLVALGSVLALRLVVRQWRRPALLWLLTPLLALDLAVVGWTLDVPAGVSDPRALLAPTPNDWMDEVAASGQRLWTATPRVAGTPGEYIRPIDKVVANTGTYRHIPTLSDYGPLQPRRFVERFGFQPWGESWQANALLADTAWCRFYNVGWILLTDPTTPAPNLATLQTHTPQGWRLYRCPAARGPVLFEDAAQPGAIRVIERTATRVVARVDTWPSTGDLRSPETWPRVVLSRLALPGWTARIDGRRTRITTIDDLLLGVRVPPGRAVAVEWTYTPRALTPGLLTSATTAVLLLGGLVWPGLKRLRRARTAASDRRA
jgi:hypothetical protein